MYASKRRANYHNWDTSKSRRSEVETESECETESLLYNNKTYNDYFVKLFEANNDIKTSLEKLDKVDIVLEYIKSVDSDSKNLTDLFLSDIKKIDDTLSELKTLVNKNTNLDHLVNNMELILNQHYSLTTLLNKVIIDHQHLKLESINTSRKLDLMLSQIEYLYFKSLNLKIEEVKEEVKEGVKEEIQEETKEEETKEEEIKEEVEETGPFKLTTRSAPPKKLSRRK